MLNVRIDRNQYQLRFTVGGKRYGINHGTVGNAQQFALMESIASQIKLDISLGQFDQSLKKYKPWDKSDDDKVRLHFRRLSSVFTRWMEYKATQGLSATSLRTRYRPVLGKVIDWECGKQLDDVDGLLRSIKESVNAQTYNERLALLKSCEEWAGEQGIMMSVSFKAHKPMKVEQKTKPKPLTKEQVIRLQDECKKWDKFRHYHPFLVFMIHTGARPSEAIGIKLGDFDWNNKTVSISSSLARDDDGNSRGSARVRKSTKTGTSRLIPLSSALQSVLYLHYERNRLNLTGEDNLMFTDINGKPIDDEYFRKHIWASLLKVCGIPYVRPYILRHTLISHLIESGASLVQAAAIAGHKDTKMVSQVYGHMVNLPVMPEFT